MSTEAYYLRDLGFLLREAAVEAKRLADAAPEAERGFQTGRLMGYYEVISVMQNQAEAFQLPLAKLALDGLDPDRDVT
jgi:hypothetical protein